MSKASVSADSPKTIKSSGQGPWVGLRLDFRISLETSHCAALLWSAVETVDNRGHVNPIDEVDREKMNPSFFILRRSETA